MQANDASGAGVRRTVPGAEMLGTDERRRADPLRVAASVVGLALVLGLPLVTGGGYVLQVVNFGIISLIVVVGLNYITGYCGQINFAQAAFYGIGAYVTALLMLKGLSFWIALPLAAMATGLCATLLGAPTLKLRAFYLAMATIGFGEIVQRVLIHWEPVTGGTSGLRGIPGVTLFGFQLQGHRQFYYFFLAWAGIALWLAVRVRYTQLGRSMIALRDSEIAAEVAGVDTRRVKTIALALSSIYAAAAGGLYVAYVNYLSPDGFSNAQAILYYTMLIIGGAGSAVGAVIGTITLTVLPEALRFLKEWYMVLYGLGVIAMVALLPEGLIGIPRRLFRRKTPPVAESPATAADDAVEASTVPTMAAPPVGQVILAVTEVVQRFGGLTALDNVSIEVREGTIHGVIGPNGCGKTTFLNVLTGAYTPDSGSVRFAGRELVGMRPFEVTRVGMSRNFQNIRLYPSLTLIENVMVGQACRSRISALQALIGTRASRADERELRRQARAALVRVGLADHADRPADSLAYGQRRLLEIARAIATRPRILLLDEPAAGMNAQETTRLMRLIREIRASGVTIVLVEHNMRLVMEICDRITVFDFGRKIAEGTPAEVRHDPAVIKAYLGHSAEGGDA